MPEIQITDEFAELDRRVLDLERAVALIASHVGILSWGGPVKPAVDAVRTIRNRLEPEVLP